MQMRMNCHHQFVFGGIFFGHRIQINDTEYSESIPIFRYEIQMYDLNVLFYVGEFLRKLKLLFA